MKDDEVLVKIEAAALNRADLMQREGDYPPPAGCPEWMGLEISGEIVAIGAVAKENATWKIGDKVCALVGGCLPRNRFLCPLELCLTITAIFSHSRRIRQK